MKESIEEQLLREGFYISTTAGVSMYPMLRNRRDRVVIRPVGEARLRRLDLPLYRRADGAYVLHRVIGVREGLYIIRGDNTYQKEHISDEQIVGVMTEFYRGERHVDATSRWYRLYAWLWQGIYPLRAVLWRAYRLAAKVKRKIFH